MHVLIITHWSFPAPAKLSHVRLSTLTSSHPHIVLQMCVVHATIPTEILIINVTGFIFANMYLFCIQYKFVYKLNTT